MFADESGTFADESGFGRRNRPRPCWAPNGKRPRVASPLVREYVYRSCQRPTRNAYGFSWRHRPRSTRQLILLFVDAAGNHIMATSSKSPTRPNPLLRSSVKSDHDVTSIICPSITEQFAEMLGNVGCARRGTFDFTTHGLQFGNQMHQCPGSKDSVRLLGRRVTQRH